MPEADYQRPDTPGGRTLRLADRLAAAQSRRFVGRHAELELFRSALASEDPSFAVLHIHGPGGLGKSVLLREYARLAAREARPVVSLDSRSVDPTPFGFELALCEALRLDEPEAPMDRLGHEPHTVLLLDGYELLAPLDVWLRQTFLPQLPAGVLVAIAGRSPGSSLDYGRGVERARARDLAAQPAPRRKPRFSGRPACARGAARTCAGIHTWAPPRALAGGGCDRQERAGGAVPSRRCAGRRAGAAGAVRGGRLAHGTGGRSRYGHTCASRPNRFWPRWRAPTTRMSSSTGCADSPSSSRAPTASSRTISRARCWMPTCVGATPLNTRDASEGLTFAEAEPWQPIMRHINFARADTAEFTEECVASHTVADLALDYRVPRLSGVSLQLGATNLFDRPYRSFAGAPEIGRLALLRARYEF